MYENFLHKKVLVRGAKSGVYVGTLEEIENSTARISNLRNVWSWEGAACLAQVAEEGIRGGKVSQEVPEALITDVCQVFPLSEIATISFDKTPVWKL